ncbi:MAG: tripartite tricarboxylate transporter substrate binding protein [Variovorax sp.]|nr:MAG: tripartite tricarboxylate transporter substrate binding protein [Variovorax sp.]
MKFRIAKLLWGALAAVSATCTMAADAYPSRPLRFIVNSAPGALLDVTTRVVAQRMSEDLGQPIVVENRPGADGAIGIRAVKAAPADGYTVLATANTLAQLPAVKLDPGYDPVNDFVGIGIMNQAPLIMVGATSLPDQNLASLIARAKSNPDKMQFASGGFGTTTHLAAMMFMHQAGVKILHVPYKGISSAVPDAMAGRVDFLFDGANSAGPNVRDGKLRAFAITSTKRLTNFPDIPTFAEQGLTDYSFYVWLGLAAPKGTPKPVVDRLSRALRAALASEPVRERLRRDGAEPGTLSPEEFTDFIRRDMQRSVKVAADLGIAKE